MQFHRKWLKNHEDNLFFSIVMVSILPLQLMNEKAISIIHNKIRMIIINNIIAIGENVRYTIHNRNTEKK